jgi:hypothetical protein
MKRSRSGCVAQLGPALSCRGVATNVEMRRTSLLRPSRRTGSRLSPTLCQLVRAGNFSEHSRCTWVGSVSLLRATHREQEGPRSLSPPQIAWSLRAPLSSCRRERCNCASWNTGEFNRFTIHGHHPHTRNAGSARAADAFARSRAARARQALAASRDRTARSPPASARQGAEYRQARARLTLRVSIFVELQ